VACGKFPMQLQRKQAPVAAALPQLQATPMLAVAWKGHEGLQMPHGLLLWDHRHQGNSHLNCRQCPLTPSRRPMVPQITHGCRTLRQTAALNVHLVRRPGLGVVPLVVAARSAFGHQMRSAGKTSVVAAQTQFRSVGHQLSIFTNPVRCRTSRVVPSVTDVLVHQLVPRIKEQHRHREVPTVHRGLIASVNARLQFTSAFTRKKTTAGAGWTRHGSSNASRRRRTSAQLHSVRLAVLQALCDARAPTRSAAGMSPPGRNQSATAMRINSWLIPRELTRHLVCDHHCQRGLPVSVLCTAAAQAQVAVEAPGVDTAAPMVISMEVLAGAEPG